MSTQNAIQLLSSKIYDGLDQRKKIICIFLDIKKAFDVVNHELLLKKLEATGFRGKALELMRSYLGKRTQRVRVGSVVSDCADVVCGIPQGTVLGPTLFNIYINNLYDASTDGHLIGFADDTVVYYEGDTWEHVRVLAENGFADLMSWFGRNYMCLNLRKTRFVSFSVYQNHTPTFSELLVKTDGRIERINGAKFVKYLGVIFDQHLRWDLHVNAVVKKMRFLLYKIRLLKDYLPQMHLRKLYVALVEPHLRYGIVAWGHAYMNHSRGLKVIKNDFLN